MADEFFPATRRRSQTIADRMLPTIPTTRRVYATMFDHLQLVSLLSSIIHFAKTKRSAYLDMHNSRSNSRHTVKLHSSKYQYYY